MRIVHKKYPKVHKLIKQAKAQGFIIGVIVECGADGSYKSGKLHEMKVVNDMEDLNEDPSWRSPSTKHKVYANECPFIAAKFGDASHIVGEPCVYVAPLDMLKVAS